MIRNDFVSNSSSSSFIIIKSFFTEHFKITAQDFKDALIALGIERLGHIMCDPKDKEESKKFFAECDDILKSWWAQVHPDRDDGMPFQYTDYGKFSNTLDGLAKAYDYLSDYVFFEAYNTKNKSKHEKLPPELYKVFLHLKDAYEVPTMSEVAHDSSALFLCHMDDNEIWGLKDVCVYRVKDIYEKGKTRKSYISEEDEKRAKECNFGTEIYTFKRILEILVRYWVSIGRVNIYDPKFIDFWKVPEDSWWKRDKRYKDREYYFEGKKLSFLDVLDSFTYAANTHEG